MTTIPRPKHVSEREWKDGCGVTVGLTQTNTLIAEDWRPVYLEKPKHIPQREWEYACLRADRARKYRLAFAAGPCEQRFEDPVWQWENEVRGRFGGIVGGSLSGTRSGEERN